jgi:hypothetical protein
MYKIKKSSFTQLEKPPLQSTRFSKGFWLDQFNLCKDVILGNIYRLFDSDEISHCLANFRIAANLQKGSHQGPPFGDGDFYKWLEAASYIYGLTKDEKLKALIDSSISLIEQVQREDGYIFTQYTIKLKEGASAQKLGNSLNFEAYNLGHLITTAIVHTQTTGEDTLLKIGIKAAFCLKELFEEAEKSNTAKTAICPSHYMALVDLYRYTGDEVHLKTAQLAIKLRDKVEQGTDDNQDRLKLAEHTEILGHAVRATYLYSGVADLYAELGSEELKTMLDRIWESEEYTKMYINSGCGALYDGVSPAGYAGDHPALNRTHQAYGRPYELPNLTAYNETCATIGNIFLNWRLFLLDKKAAHADRIEQSFYNLILASVSRDGLKYFYSNPLAREQETLPFHLKWERTRSEYLSSFCCPPNMLRILSQASEYTYALGEEAIYIGIYGASNTTLHVAGKTVKIEQQTDYPFDGKIVLTFAQEEVVQCTLHLRIPSWVKSGSITTKGKTRLLTEEDANTFIPFSDNWKAPDSIIIEFDLQPRLMAAHPLVEASTHQVAVMRGPILYCSEEIDQQEDNYASLGIRSNAQFTVEMKSIANTTVPVLMTKDGVSYASLNWSDKNLYQELVNLQVQPSTVTLIPYFVWDNRGLGGMKIWHPLYL